MISDNKLIKISLIVSVLGLIAILFSSQTIVPEIVEIGDINENNIGQYISIEGVVTDLDSSGNTTFIEISDDVNSIKGIIFEGNLNKEIFEGDELKLFGNIEIYKNEIEIIIKKIE